MGRRDLPIPRKGLFLILIRSGILPFLIGVILTSIIFTLMRSSSLSSNWPIISATPTATPSVTPTPATSEEVAAAIASERERCQTVLDLYQVPLLVPPEFHSSTPERFETNHEGEVQVKWTPVLRAQSYYVSVVDRAGNEVRAYRSNNPSVYLKGLPRPDKKEREKYLVKIASVNANELTGTFSAPRELIVTRPLDLTAPKIKEIRVED